VTFELKSARGPYRLSLARPPELLPDATVLTLSIERLDGIEKVALQCRVSSSLVGNLEVEEIVGRVASWIERDFEMTRENALKSIRSERKLWVVSFDASTRGPF
jgi:hypothetical protein